MKAQAILMAAAALYSGAAMCQSSERGALIEQIETFYVQGQVLSPESPVIDMFLAPAKTVNTEVSPQVWARVRKDMAVAIRKLLTEKNGLLDLAVRNSVQNMSDAELVRLAQIFKDPAFNKFQNEMNSPATQQKIFQGLIYNTEKLNSAINEVLSTNGLKEVH